MKHYRFAAPFFPESGQEPENAVYRVELAGDLDRKLIAHVEGRRSKGIMILGTLKVGKSTAIEQLRKRAMKHDNVLMTHYLDSFQNRFTVTKLDEIFTGQKTVPTTIAEGIHWLWWFAKAIVALYVRLAVLASSLKIIKEPDLLDRLTWYAMELKILKKSVVIFIDDLHKVNKSELHLLSKVFNMTERHNLPIQFVIAGMPRIMKMADEAGTELVAAFDVHTLTLLNDEQSRSVIEKTAKDHGREFSKEAVDEIVRLSKGSPYTLQLLGAKAWDQTESDVVTSQDVKAVIHDVKKILTEAHFRRLWRRPSLIEKKFAITMASLPSEKRTFAIITSFLEKGELPSENTAKMLIDNDIICTVNDGRLEFTLPFFDEYIMERAQNEEEIG